MSAELHSNVKLNNGTTFIRLYTDETNIHLNVMANKKITELPAAAELFGPELFEVVQGGINKQATIDQILDLVPDSTFGADFIVSLSGGKTLGKYTNGQTVPAAGKTPMEVLMDIAIEYINPAFSSFSISGQPTTVEIGTTISGSKTATWAITENSGDVNVIDIYDVTTATTLLADTPNDGTQAFTATTIQLNTNGATQVWRGVLKDANNSNNTINSPSFTVISRFYRFFGPTASSPANSAAVRALPSSAFHTAGTFTLATGNTQTKFVVALPPGLTITSVIDTSALNADITSSYVLTGTVSVTDAGGTSRSYNIYEMNIGAPYSSSHNHSITTT